MNAADKPCAEPLPEHGTEPTPPSDGAGPTHSEMMALLMRQADIIERLVCQNQDLIAAMTDQDDEQEEQGLGVDMAGNPVRVS